MGSTRAKIVISIVVSSFLLLGAGIALTHDPKKLANTQNVILGTQIGGSCTLENEAINTPGIGGGSLFCLKTSNGSLVWSDFNKITVDKYLNSKLPSCSTPLFKKAILTPGMRQLAQNYFKMSNLLPIKVTMWGEANRVLFADGTRTCSNGIGAPLGAYSGFIPKEASAGWAIYIIHKADQFGNSNFLDIVKIGNTYKVMRIGTSP